MLVQVWRRGLFVLFLLGASCSKTRSNVAAPQASASSAVVVTPSAVSSVKVTRSNEAALTDASVRALLAAWLDAQNRGDFAAYEKLYAERFNGIKRSGSYRANFDLKRWLFDRKGMFTHAMKVEANGVELSLTPQVARVQFEQSFSTAGYSDTGPKRMIIVASAEGPRISREEMLSSKVQTEKKPAVVEDLHVVAAEGLVLETKPAEEWASGKARPGSSETVALRAVDETKLPNEMLAWKGRAIRIFGASGALCESTVVGFELRAEVVPHFGMVNVWRGQEGEPPLSRAEIAEQVWDLGFHGGRVLVGKLSTVCPGTWAVDAARTPPSTAAPEPAEAALRDAALRALRARPEYKKRQDEFRETAPEPKGRWEHYADHKLTVTAFRYLGKVALVNIAISADAGCGDFQGFLSAIYAVRDGNPNALEYLGESTSLAPTSAFDLEGDGSLEVLFGDARHGDGASLWRRGAKGGLLETLFDVPFLDCGC